MVIEKIHAVWLGNRLSALALACIDDWNKQGFEYKVWTEEDSLIKKWINECEFAKECYDRKLYAFVSDYLRLKVLQHEGGLYLDTDVTIRKKPFHLFEGQQFVIGFASENHVGISTIYSMPDSDVLNDVICFYENEIMQSPLFMGPKIMSKFVLEGNYKGIKILPIDYFHGYKGKGKEHIPCSDNYVIHWGEFSWKNPKKVSYLKSKHMGFWGKLYTSQKYLFRK
ncbi:glycosyltransferase family 32 protein [Vibrio sp. PID23_8]|uniref:glycosyltransferase family 32 protein n=1 Tax=Vibrio sp. PID23_8 TaxID=1583767 RepID=UPI000E6962FE|nr:glycosyltransferase [Vibrio sp. PID23_8]RIZ50786.1 mannosyltransferase [Vibrio sp. PID23_8]